MKKGVVRINLKIGIFRFGNKTGQIHEHGTSFCVEEINLEKLYDINRNPSGVIIYKGESIPEDLYEMMVSIFIENSDGELLIKV